MKIVFIFIDLSVSAGETCYSYFTSLNDKSLKRQLRYFLLIKNINCMFEDQQFVFIYVWMKADISMQYLQNGGGYPLARFVFIIRCTFKIEKININLPKSNRT